MRTSILKVIAAFVAGLVLALASALFYVRAQDSKMRTPEVLARDAPPEAPPEEVTPPPVVTPQQPEPQPQLSSDQATPSVPQHASTDAARAARETAASPRIKKAIVRPPVVQRPDPTPVQVVQNTGSPTVIADNLPNRNQATYPPLSQQPATDQPTAASVRPKPNMVELAAGTPLTIRLGETLSTEHNYAGDTFRGTLEAPIIRNGFVIADKGSKVLGRIEDSTSSGRVRGLANLSLTLTEINTTDGQRIRVETNAVEKRSTATNGADAAKIAGGAAIGAIIGALGGGGRGAAIGAGAGGAAGTGVVLATRGRPATLPTESLLTFQLTNPVTITEKLN